MPQSSGLKAITVHQPWAWAIAYGGKTIENRTTAWRHRGPLAIHAGLAWDEHGEHSLLVQEAWSRWRHGLPPMNTAKPVLDRASLWLAWGAIVAVADLVDVHLAAPFRCCRPWGESDAFHLVLENVRAVDQPVACRSRQGLWNVPEEITQQVTQPGREVRR